MVASKILSLALLNMISITVAAHEITIMADPAGVIIDNNSGYTVTLDNFHATLDYTQSPITLSPGQKSNVLHVYQCRASTDQGAIDYSVAPKKRMCPGMSEPVQVITIQAEEDQEFLHYDKERDLYYFITKQ